MRARPDWFAARIRHGAVVLCITLTSPLLVGAVGLALEPLARQPETAYQVPMRPPSDISLTVIGWWWGKELQGLLEIKDTR